MGFFDKLGDALTAATDTALRQSFMNEGFEDGANAKSPRFIFPNPPFCKTAYDEGYARGQQVAVARALSNR